MSPNPNASSSSTYNHLVPKLTGANYATWKTKMEMLLIRAGLWPIVSQRKPRPTSTTASTSSSRTRSSTTGPSSDDEAAIKWDEDAERATAEIFLYLDERVESRVHDIRNPVELWGKLQTFYERKGFSARFYLWQKLFTLQLADYRKHEGNAMDLYLDAFRMHIQQLRSSGAIVSNEIEASVLLNGLDDGYESFIVSTTQSIRQTADDDEIDVEQLVSQLCDEDRRHAAGRTPTEVGDPSTGSALYSNRKRPRHQFNHDRPLPICNYCNQAGHRQDNCWSLHPEKKSESRYTKHARLAEASIVMASAGITPGERDLF